MKAGRPSRAQRAELDAEMRAMRERWRAEADRIRAEWETTAAGHPFIRAAFDLLPTVEQGITERQLEAFEAILRGAFEFLYVRPGSGRLPLPLDPKDCHG